MCWLLQLIGGLFVTVGVVTLVLFFYGRGTGTEGAETSYRPTTLLLGTISLVMGILLVILGLVQGICQSSGIA